jgi:hypothetical protein
MLFHSIFSYILYCPNVAIVFTNVVAKEWDITTTEVYKQYYSSNIKAYTYLTFQGSDDTLIPISPSHFTCRCRIMSVFDWSGKRSRSSRSITLFKITSSPTVKNAVSEMTYLIASHVHSGRWAPVQQEFTDITPLCYFYKCLKLHQALLTLATYFYNDGGWKVVT